MAYAISTATSRRRRKLRKLWLAMDREEFIDLDSGVQEDERSGDCPEETDATAFFAPGTSASTFKSPALLTKTDIKQMLPTLNHIESWIEATFAYVSSEAINHSCHGTPELRNSCPQILLAK